MSLNSDTAFSIGYKNASAWRKFIGPLIRPTSLCPSLCPSLCHRDRSVSSTSAGRSRQGVQREQHGQQTWDHNPHRSGSASNAPAVEVSWHASKPWRAPKRYCGIVVTSWRHAARMLSKHHCRQSQRRCRPAQHIRLQVKRMQGKRVSAAIRRLPCPLRHRRCRRAWLGRLSAASRRPVSRPRAAIPAVRK